MANADADSNVVGHYDRCRVLDRGTQVPWNRGPVGDACAIWYDRERRDRGRHFLRESCLEMAPDQWTPRTQTAARRNMANGATFQLPRQERQSNPEDGLRCHPAIAADDKRSDVHRHGSLFQHS